MPSFTDQAGRSVILNDSPGRIVSLVPSQTELLHHLDLGDKVVGITKFCVHPEIWYRSKTRVGGTKTIRFDIIEKLQPDLIIANKEENVKEQVEQLADKYPVWVSDVNNLQDAYSMIESVGLLTGTGQKAAALIQQTRANFESLALGNSQLASNKIAAAYLIWKDPYMAAAGDTFINDMLLHCNLENIFSNNSRYPLTSIEELIDRGCNLVLLASEPFPFKQKHADELIPQLPNCKIICVDGEYFSWYGSRLLHAPAYFVQLKLMINNLMVAS